ncbi:MAG: hypothetical protein WD875_16310 [Pirellulales bacterium]
MSGKSKSLHDTLANVRTADEERLAFTRLHADAGNAGLTFEALDAAGGRLDMGVPDWWKSAATLRISVGDETAEHRVLDGKNIGLLMGE